MPGYLTLREICEELALVDDRLVKLEAKRPADVATTAFTEWHGEIMPVRQRMHRLVKMLGHARRNHVGAERKHYRPIVDQVLAEAPAPVPQTCQWWHSCEKPATTTEDHHKLGPVPICDDCKASHPQLTNAAPLIAASLRSEQ